MSIETTASRHAPVQPRRGITDHKRDETLRRKGEGLCEDGFACCVLSGGIACIHAGPVVGSVGADGDKSSLKIRCSCGPGKVIERSALEARRDCASPVRAK